MNELIINNINKTYANGVKALDDVSVTITNGMFGLLGPNGAGKSTLMRTIAALQEPDEGSISFNGNDVIKDPSAIRRQLGYLPQEFGVYPKISAYRLLDHLAILKGILDNRERKEQIEALLQQTNLYQDRKKVVSTFSGGMRQRFGIAQALLGDPQLIIVDEPTAGLDPEERNRFHNLLSEIGENIIVLLSTHIVEDVRDLCTRMAIMSEGGLVLEGEPRQLIKDLRGKIWEKAISKDALEAHKAAYTVISTRLFAGETQIHVLSDDDPGQGFQTHEPGLEDVYFSILFDQQSVNC
ncbi:ABC transporter ATP-binding protein [Fulvivirgaceae bacterium BMA10]|uniref:ABC transporter ATP-binding protein n=1 Tax=Splendidivirga corallicola TaxID=3051826 RepID=A0ABT8KID5_9BACT|nr:ABC transporter ATP-binding protein [Fulvivirgaceae bacterium BMA10]